MCRSIISKIPEQWTIRGHTINFCGMCDRQSLIERGHKRSMSLSNEEYKDDVNMYITNCDVASMMLLCVHFRDSLILAIENIVCKWCRSVIYSNTTPLRHVWVSLNVQELFSTNMVNAVKWLLNKWMQKIFKIFLNFR